MPTSDLSMDNTAVGRLLRLYQILGDTQRLEMWRSLHRGTLTSADVRSDSVFQLKRLECPGEVVGAAYLLGILYVIVKDSEDLLLYLGRSPYALLKSVHIEGMKPADIYSSYTDTCVYILCDVNDRVWRVITEHSKHNVTVSEAESTCVLVVGHKIISTFGVPSTSRALLEPVKNFRHAVENPEDELIVCEDDAIFRIADTGPVNRRTGIGGNYMALNANDDVILADQSKHQVLLLDSSTLNTKKTLLIGDRDGIECPRHVHYARENGLLLVSWLSYVDVYSFNERDTRGHLAASKEDVEEQQTREVHFLETQIARSEIFQRLKQRPSLRQWTPREPSPSLSSAELWPSSKESTLGVLDNFEEIFPWLARQKWAVQYYHDVKEDRVHIAVDSSRREEAARCIQESYPHTNYVLEDCSDYRFLPGADEETHRRRLARSTSDLLPGKPIYSPDMKCFLFSGSLLNMRTGLTVGHSLAVDNEIAMDEEGSKVVVGKCLHTLEKTNLETGDMITVDLALLQIYDRLCTVDNTIRWPDHRGRKIRPKICKGQIPNNTEVMVLNQYSEFRYGSIRRRQFTDTLLRTNGLYNVLAIGSDDTFKEQSITELGDSGALVMSIPTPSQDFVYVYGIVIGVVEAKDKDFSMTLANSLWNVIRAAAHSGDINMFNFNCNFSEDIDFV